MVEKTRPRNSFGTWRRSCEVFSTELTATAPRERPMKNSAHAERGAWLNRTYDAAVNHVADRDSALVGLEAEIAAPEALASNAPQIRPTPAQPQMTPMPAGPR